MALASLSCLASLVASIISTGMPVGSSLVPGGKYCLYGTRLSSTWRIWTDILLGPSGWKWWSWIPGLAQQCNHGQLHPWKKNNGIIPAVAKKQAALSWSHHWNGSAMWVPLWSCVSRSRHQWSALGRMPWTWNDGRWLEQGLGHKWCYHVNENNDMLLHILHGVRWIGLYEYYKP